MTKTRARSASNAPSAPTTPTPTNPTPARRNAASAELEDQPARPRPAASSSTVGYLDARNGTHNFTFSVASATTEDLVTELTTRVNTLDERLHACDRKVSQSVEAARAESASLREEQASHLKTKQQLRLLEITSEANTNAAEGPSPWSARRTPPRRPTFTPFKSRSASALRSPSFPRLKPERSAAYPTLSARIPSVFRNPLHPQSPTAHRSSAPHVSSVLTLA
ncbi:unnamed protein product [Tilletia controversa]|nr:hypothetical protein CF328_g7897 [Tilletia controversa]CAD6955732.1 unnamed protein product [Tilletia controversa]CAD6980455.1 unnamed protein product [Tilletia controversa]CAD6983455.1 unnamed protein product [Tilletia controversa]